MGTIGHTKEKRNRLESSSYMPEMGAVEVPYMHRLVYAHDDGDNMFHIIDRFPLRYHSRVLESVLHVRSAYRELIVLDTFQDSLIFSHRKEILIL